MKPWVVDVQPDMFGYHLHVEGRRFFIPKELYESVVEALIYWREQSEADAGTSNTMTHIADHE